MRVSWRLDDCCLLRVAWLAVVAALVLTTAARGADPGPAVPARMIVVAIADNAEAAPTAGSTPRGYVGLPNYSGSDRAVAEGAHLARDYGLHEISAWTIDPLRLRCMLFELAPDADRESVLTHLHADDRVRLAQPLQSFDTLTAALPDGGASVSGYNDPYVGLQHGFSAIGAAQAQRFAHGDGVKIALIDTGIDAGHPDLAGRVATQRDFVTGASNAPALDRHGTEVAGVIAAVANNGLGIAGIAPGVRLYSYRACWPIAIDTDPARCNTYTLAQALAAAIASGARVINLSLGGPPDPLLAELTTYALGHGAIVVGAVPPDGRMDGFPVDVPGVIAVTDGSVVPQAGSALIAPGQDILTLEPGGRYDYASGSSLSTAHVSGAIALLVGVEPRLDAQAAFALLRDSEHGANASINVCQAVLATGRERGSCR
ncbi:MAG: S8 family peptidase [Lysobacterales bacterium]